MKNIEQNLPKRKVRWPLAWVIAGAVACLGLGALVSVREDSAREQPKVKPSIPDQSGEIDRLKQAVRLLQQKSALLAAAVSSSVRAADAQPVNEEPKVAPVVKETRLEAEIQQDQTTELEARFASENDGSRDNLLATHKLQTELNAAPLDGARITEAACSTSLCRAILEKDSNAMPLDVNALIESTPTVMRESRFTYDEEGSIKRVTIYSAREGHRLNPTAPD